MAKLRGYVICNSQKFPELAQIRDSVHAKLIEFIILTAVRADQTKGMKWKEIDLGQQSVELPMAANQDW
jgi:hypothetical protein